MLKKLDIYIIKKYLTTFLFVVLIFLMVSAIIDFSEKIEKFVESEIHQLRNLPLASDVDPPREANAGGPGPAGGGGR